MKRKYRVFDSATVALARGVNLVEASAGTGKTYAIAMLVLRAVVELEISIDRILIVTFTKAATDELRSRIRTRLVEARNMFAGGAAGGGKVDDTLAAWAATIPAGDRQAAFNRLQLALADIDRAGIFTIHGFCQRMLVEQALESGQLFDVELLTDIEHVRTQIADDFWRSRIYGLAPLPCSILTGAFPSPEKLLGSVSLACRENCLVEPPAGSLNEVLTRLELAMDGLVSWWQAHGRQFSERCRAGIDEGLFKKEFGEGFASWCRALDDFFAGKTKVLPENIHRLNRRHLAQELNGQKLRGDAKKQAYLGDWQLPDEMADALLAASSELVLTLRVQLAEKLRAELSHRLELQGTMGFDDLILRLSRALQGERGEALVKVLGTRYAMALIDEFQDTDPAQYHIFSSIFGGSAHYLYLIGDPKQAIYKFRGADIHSYFLAQQSATELLTLDKNYRSHPFLVEEVNRLFGSRQRPFFFAETTLGYRPVAAAKGATDGDLVRAGESLAGMVYCTLSPTDEEKSGRWTSGKAIERFRRFAVAEIGRLLDRTDPVTLQAGEERLLAPHDIAILVRSHRQGEEYRQALVDAGIPAVVSSRESVFHTAECRELLLLLQAIASPGEMVKLKTAMTISWFGLTGNDLYDLWRDEERFGAFHSRFLGYNRQWQEAGFLAMMSRLLVDEEVLVTLAAGRMAERAIANIHQLLELVQEQETAENLGIGEVLQWLQRTIRAERGSDNAELLLESDEEAVRIITMHGAKGLEFPVVFCPFLWYRSNRLAGERNQVSCHDDRHSLVVDLGSAQFGLRREKAVEEEMAEDLRLLYVALTRAGLRCYTMWADVKPYANVADSFQSPLGYLLFPDGPQPREEQQAGLQALVRQRGVQLVEVAGDDEPPAAMAQPDQRELHPLSPSGRSLYTDWQMSSFSALAMQSEYEQETEQMPRVHPGTTARPLPVAGLPAGAGFGNVIHDLLQLHDFSAIARQEMNSELLGQKCRRYGVTVDPALAAELLKNVVATPLFAGESDRQFSLAMLDERRCLKEMAFYYRLGRLTTDRINTVLAAEPTVVPLSHKTMRGYLTGFVDLFCEYRGKYYILDYKTNYLGANLADYQGDRLVAAMQSHNYGLQYWIYTLVLHRHLGNLLDEYSYADHFGGVFYLFVRGMTPDIPGSGVYATLPDYRTLAALDQATGGDEDE
jgi:exodeoxyribonuclease V beta subunit